MDCARAAAEAGARVISNAFPQAARGVARTKGESTVDLVTDTDLAAEAAITDVIRTAFPGDAILAEETHRAAADSERLWIVDPLDGTTNFAHGIAHAAVSIAFYEAGIARCGVVFNPMTGERFEAEKDCGATRNGKPIRVSDHQLLSETLIGVGFYYDRGAMMESTLAAIRDLFGKQIHGIRRFGTASLDLCRVACGMYGAFFEYQLSPWDFAAGRLIAEEAGGQVTTCAGQSLPISVTSVLATNQALHSQILPIVQRHQPS